MPARPIWRGQIRLALVSIPVELFPATRSGAQIQFHQVHEPSGQRVHKPFVFTSALNKATPLMYQALASGEMLPKVEVKWYRTSTEGKQEHFFTTHLEDATIVDIVTALPHAQDATKAEYTQLVEVSMAYRKITWTHAIAGTEASDDWRKPQEA